MGKKPKWKPGEDLQMMQDPDEWPYWPQLPLKRRFRDKPRKPGPMYGFLVAIPELRPIVFVGLIGAVQENRPTIEYSSFEELLEDGWLVD